jgi:hypothetical protein
MVGGKLPHPELDFFRSRHRPYYIATGEWMQTSMGYRAPFLLCHILNELGYEAYVTAQKPAPKLRTPILTSHIIRRHNEDNRNIIAVYNEGMWGNVLKGDVLVRWLMNRLGMSVDTLPQDDDLYFYWDAIYSAEHKNVQILRLPSVDSSVFHARDSGSNSRNGFAYYAHKYIRDGKGEISEKVKSHGISLCQDIDRSQEEIADILCKIKVLYVYEETTIAVEAAMCGCVVVLVMNKYIYELYGEKDPYDYVVWEDELNPETDWGTTTKLIEIYNDECQKSERHIYDFILKTQSAPIPRKKTDELSSFVMEHKNIYLYGAGITSTMVYNVLKAIGVSITGFIVTDKFYSKAQNRLYGLPVVPFSNFNKDLESCGIVLAMTRSNSQQVVEELERRHMNYVNPALL